MLNAFTVESYRSFAAATRIELRPITLLLGRNSSGKSSLTRLIPLLQQSLDRRTASPILWNSDDVDFGDITNVINSASPTGELKISLEIDGSRYNNYVVTRSPFMWSPPAGVASLGAIKFTAVLSDSGGRTRYKSTVIQIEDQRLEIYWSEQSISKITLNGREINDYFPYSDVFATTTNLFPSVGIRTVGRRNALLEPPGSGLTYYTQAPFYSGLVSSFDYFINKKTGQAKRLQLRRLMAYVPPSQIHNYVARLDHKVKSKLKHESKLRDLSDAMLVNEFPQILQFLDSIMRPMFEAAAYLGPARASGARFYRYQELSVDRIDPRGENLPMYLSSLNEYEMQNFNNLMQSACGFQVRVKHAGGHASILVGRDESHMENLADVGFGFSQFLPIIAQIHAATQRSPSRIASHLSAAPTDTFIMAVEQPELHLHPAFQAALADMFVSASKRTNRGISRRRFLIETHSEAMLGRLSELVAMGTLPAEDAIIYFVEKPDDGSESTVRVGGFDSDGNIDNWPLGFFSGVV